MFLNVFVMRLLLELPHQPEDSAAFYFQITGFAVYQSFVAGGSFYLRMLKALK
jgi:hypothetical protein